MHAEGYPLSLQRPVAECPPLGLVQRQVCFDLASDLGDAPSLPMDLANFIGKKPTDEWIDAPYPSVPLMVDPPKLPHDKDHQCCPSHMGGA